MQIEKIVHPLTQRDRSGKLNIPVFCKITFDDGKLSISGVEGPLRNGDAKGGAGQIAKHIRGDHGHRLSPGWSKEMLETLVAVWEEWHLNDMKPGCEHQRAAGWDKQKIDPKKPLNAYGKFFPGQRQDSWNMLGWITPDEHPQGLLGRPCPECGYEYGTKWMKEEVPGEVLDFLDNLPDTDREPAWI